MSGIAQPRAGQLDAGDRSHDRAKAASELLVAACQAHPGQQVLAPATSIEETAQSASRVQARSSGGR